MKKYLLFIVPLFCYLVGTFWFSQAQTTVQGGRTSSKGGLWDFSVAGATNMSRQGTGSPNARDNCAKVGESYVQTDASNPANIWYCTTAGTPGTWAQAGAVSITGGAGITASPSPLTGTGTVGLSTIANGAALCNNSGSTAAPTASNCMTTGTGSLAFATSPTVASGTFSNPTLTGTVTCASCIIPLGSSGTTPKALNTTSIAAGGTDAVTVTLSGVTVNSKIFCTPTSDPTAVNGYAPGTGLSIWCFPTSNTINITVANNSTATVARSALSMSWIAWP